MNRNEAIYILRNAHRYFFPADTPLGEALDLAIEALEREIEYGQGEEVDYCNNCPYISWGNDYISRQDVTEAIEGVDWYHVNPKGELVHGSTSDEESWYKAEDIYKAIESLPPVTHEIRTETHGVCSDCISRQAAIDAVEKAVFKGVAKSAIESLPPVTPTEQNEEDILKFYYVESLDEYWIGQRCGTRYYGKWTGNCFTYGYSRYLPWGEHVVAPDTLWKEHTYPSEPKEIPFNEWLQGFLEKELQTERTGMIKVDGLIKWAKLNAYGRSETIYHGWIRAEDLQSLVYKIVEAEPMDYEPFNKGGDTE